MQLFDYQIQLENDIRSAFIQGYRAPLVVLPTGGGKTIVFTSIVRKSLLKGNKVLILVHKIELISQTSEKLHAFGIAHGIINAKYSPDYKQSVQIATIGTYINRLDCFEPDYIIVDEAHHAPAGQWAAILKAKAKARVTGFTATPCRQDGKPLNGFFDNMIMGPYPSELVALGRLMEPVVFSPELEMDLSGVDIVNGEYNSKQLAGIIKNSKIVGDAVQMYKQHCDNKRAIAFCVNIEEAEKTAASFRAAGYNSVCVTGETDTLIRKQAMKDLATGKIQVMCTVDIVSEGTDIPAVEVAIMLRPTASTSLFIQQAGRVLRVSEGKSEAIILDLAGNIGRWINCIFFENHGLPTLDREWSLEEGLVSRKKNGVTVPTVSACKKCYFTFKSGIKICPRCGTEVQKTVQEIKIVEGELRRLEMEREIIVKKEARKEVGKVSGIADMIRLERQRGYNKGWAKNAFEGKILSFLKKSNLSEPEKIVAIDNKFGIKLINLEPAHIKSAVYREYLNNLTK
jgi:DNA repair protein RadD